MKRTAFFDFDGTLIKGDSFLLVARRSLNAFRLLKGAIVSMPRIIGWKLGLVSNSVAKERLFAVLFGGMPESDFLRICEEVVPEFDRRQRHDVMDLLRSHRERGDETVIVSASIRQWIEPWAKRNGVDMVLATEPEIIGGRLTGRFSTPNCHGEEKVRRILRSFPALAEMDTWAYGDSDGDRQMIALATHGKRV